MQTWAVHMRRPSRLYRELGAGGFAAFQLTVGGTVLAALVHPFFLALLTADFLNGTLTIAGASLLTTLHKSIALTLLLSGYVCSGLLGLLGLARRGMLPKRMGPVDGPALLDAAFVGNVACACPTDDRAASLGKNRARRRARIAARRPAARRPHRGCDAAWVIAPYA